MLTRRGLLRAGGAGAAGFAVGGGLAASRAGAEAPKIAEDGERPNALVIMASNLRFDFVGAFDDSDEMAQTPNLDALAEESLRFQHGVAESMPTVPARRALLTGARSFPFRDWTRTPQMPGDPGWNPIRDHITPIATGVMRDHGVTTAYATDNPFLVGPHFANFRETLDEYKGQLSQASWRDYNRPYTREAPGSQVSDYLLPALEGTDEERRLRQYVDWNRRNRGSEDDYSAARVGRDAVGLLGDLKERQPFFLGVDFFDPVEPFDPPERYLERFGGSGSRPILIQPFETPYGRVADLDLDEGAVERVRQLYAAEVTFVDAWIGRVLNELDAQGLAGNTLVVFLSDHGISLGERGIVGRFSERAYEEVYRIPYMIRHPNGRLAGEERRWFASTHDVAPTVLSFMGITRPGRMTGEDLTCYFEAEEAKPPSRRYFTTGFGESIMVGTEDWMLATDGRGSNKRLYERDEDEGQEENVLNEHPFIEERLAEAIIVACGGTIPIFDDQSAVRPGPEGGEAFVDRDGDGEPDTDEDEELQDQRDAQERAPLDQGMSGSLSDPRYLFACACGAVLAFKVRRHAIEEAERHYREAHPELAEDVDCEELVRECSPEEAEASAGAAAA